MKIMEATPEFKYRIEKNPELQEIGTVLIYTDIVTPMDIDLELARSRFSCLLSGKELIEDEEFLRKQELYRFFIESCVDELDAIKLMRKLIRLAIKLTSSVEYLPHYALSILLTLDVIPSNQELNLDDSQIEEASRALLDDYEGSIGFRPASKLGVRSLSRRIYKKKPKTSLIAGSKTKRKTSLITDSKTKRKTSLIADSKTKRETSTIADRCAICLAEFKDGRKLVTLPCGHEFDNKCGVKWLKVNHFCPLCRFELPPEDVVIGLYHS